ncbi:hypothetical protein [Kitasatospora griseola]|uniref:hypothetical protein n=1 Tax=Kitasatospora griseola TaxID=2064 RepID=UPI00380D54F3
MAEADTFGCLTTEQAAAGSTRLTVDGGNVGAYYRDSDSGKATGGVVFALQAGGSLCDWQSHSAEFTAAGYAVVGWTVNGGGASDVRAAIGLLTSKGVTSVALVGASNGASASLEAAADPANAPLPIKAVVSLSSPEAAPGESNAAKAVLTGTVPDLLRRRGGRRPLRRVRQGTARHRRHPRQAAQDLPRQQPRLPAAQRRRPPGRPHLPDRTRPGPRLSPCYLPSGTAGAAPQSTGAGVGGHDDNLAPPGECAADLHV